jgi:hypothetical protein
MADLLLDRFTRIIVRRHYFAPSPSYRDNVMQALKELKKKRSNDDDHLRNCYSKTI